MPRGRQAQEEFEEFGEENEAGDGEEVELGFHPIDDLTGLGINQSDIKKLQTAGCHTVESVVMTPKKNLQKIKGLSEAKVSKILVACDKLAPVGFITGSTYSEKRANVFNVSTGCTALDEMLGGGIESRSITEVFGEFRTGKTQLCHTLAVTAQLGMEQGGGAGRVIYIDTEGTFRDDKVRKIAERFGLDPDAALDNISIARAHTSDQQLDLLQKACALMMEEHYSLIIIDSVTALFRVDYSGRGELSARQQKLGQLLSQLTKIAEAYNVGAFITNQVMSDPSGGAMFVSDPKKPIGGHVLAHASTTRLYLRKGRGEQRIAKVYDSPSLPEAEAIYCLTDAGVGDASD